MPPSLTTLQCLLPGGCHLFRAAPSGPAGFLQRISTLISSLFPFFLDFSWRYMSDSTLSRRSAALAARIRLTSYPQRIAKSLKFSLPKETRPFSTEKAAGLLRPTIPARISVLGSLSRLVNPLIAITFKLMSRLFNLVRKSSNLKELFLQQLAKGGQL
jgi:hypothetical protein